MDRKKLKLLVLLILVAVNLFLAVNLAITYSSAVSAEKKMLSDALFVINREDFDEKAFSSLPRYLYSYSLSGTQNALRDISLSLLGENAEIAENSGATVFSKGGAHFSFDRSGETGGLILYDNTDTADHISRAFSSKIITCSAENSFVSCDFDGFSVFNAGISVSSTDGRVSFSGAFPAGDAVRRLERSISRGALALTLYDYTEQFDFGKLKNLSAVYAMRYDSQRITLFPCLRADFEGGALIIDMNDKSLVYSGD